MRAQRFKERAYFIAQFFFNNKIIFYLKKSRFVNVKKLLYLRNRPTSQNLIHKPLYFLIDIRTVKAEKQLTSQTSGIICLEDFWEERIEIKEVFSYLIAG